MEIEGRLFLTTDQKLRRPADLALIRVDSRLKGPKQVGSPKGDQTFQYVR
jgi:hypothetical protein